MSLLDWLKGKKPGAAVEPPPARACPSSGAAVSSSASSGRKGAEHLGHLWGELDAIAREDGHTAGSAVEHYNRSAEGKKDVERWLEIYHRRRHPEVSHPPPPPHLRRHRGHVIVPRVWPEGLRWQAIHEETLLKAKIPDGATPEEVIAALDRLGQ